MTITTRRFLYCLFILLFLGAAMVVLYVAGGYRYDWRQRTFYQPGLIVLGVAPRPTGVTVDGQPAKNSGDPIRLGPLASGIHTVRLERDGYRPWEARVMVNDGQATTMSDIRLFRQAEPIEHGQNIRWFVPATGTTKIALVNATNELLVFDTGAQTTTLLLPHITGTLDDLAWTTNGEQLMVRATANEVQTIRLIDRSGTVNDLALPVFAGDLILPNSRRADRLWLLRRATLSEIFLTTHAVTVVAENVHAWAETGDRLLVLYRDGKLVELSANDTAAAPKTIASLGAMQQPHFLSPSPESLISIIDEAARKLVLVRRNEQPVTSLTIENITMAEWNSSLNQLVLANSHEVFLLDRNEDDPVLLRRSGEPYALIRWIDGRAAILAVQNNNLLVIDARRLFDPFVIASGNSIGVAITQRDEVLILDNGSLRAIPL